MKPMYDAIKDLLLERGWKIDEAAKEDGYGVVKEFIHPDTNRRRAYFDAIADEGTREYRKGKSK